MIQEVQTTGSNKTPTYFNHKKINCSSLLLDRKNLPNLFRPKKMKTLPSHLQETPFQNPDPVRDVPALSATIPL